MRLIKLSSIFAVLGFVFLALSYVAARGLDQSKKYKYPESVARHYGKAADVVFQGFDGEAVAVKKSIPLESTNGIETVNIETIGVNVAILEGGNDQIEVELKSNRVDPKEPLL